MRTWTTGFAALAAVVMAAAALPADTAEAGSRGSSATAYHGGYFGLGASYRGGRSTRVYGYRQSVGGYSYSKEDTTNTSGLDRSRFGGTNAYRDPSVDTQTLAGPFDHGWFFDSGNAPRGGNSPYMN